MQRNASRSAGKGKGGGVKLTTSASPPPLFFLSVWCYGRRRKTLDYEAVLGGLEKKGISIRVASPKLVMEEAPESYKDVTEVVNTCHDAGISMRAVKLRPIAVIKG